MSSYKNYQSDNQKHSRRESRTNHNPEFNSSVDAMSTEHVTHLEKNIDKYIEFLSWARWYPDLFLDLMKPDIGGIELHSDQRVFLRVHMRFASLYGIFPRGYGKTFNEVLLMFVMCILFPGIELSLTAQTKDNASKLLKAKYMDIVKKYPEMDNEIFDKKFSKNDAEIVFLNQSRIDVLANRHESKGQRRHQINIEESVLLDDFIYQDALYPIVEHGRPTVGKLATQNPEELSQKVNFFSTAGFRGSDEFARCFKMIDNMANLTGDFVLGADWHLGCWYGRGSNKAQIIKRRKNMSTIAFARNYESKWVGVVGNGVVNINKLINLRNIENPQFSNINNDEIYLAMDVARSEKDSNNISSIAVLKVIRDKKRRIVNIQLINLISILPGANFEKQVIILKRLKKKYEAIKIIYDHNGLGTGIGDEIVKEHYDVQSDEILPALQVENIDIPCDYENAERCVYAVQSQGENTKMIVNLMDMVDGGVLQLLVNKHDNAYEEIATEELAPHGETDLLIEEIANIKLKQLSGNNMREERQITSIPKDRYSALKYGLYYIIKHQNRKTSEDDVTVEDLYLYRKPKTRKI